MPLLLVRVTLALKPATTARMGPFLVSIALFLCVAVPNAAKGKTLCTGSTDSVGYGLYSEHLQRLLNNHTTRSRTPFGRYNKNTFVGPPVLLLLLLLLSLYIHKKQRNVKLVLSVFGEVHDYLR